MSVRNRAVIFRLTEDDHATLRNACRQFGGRNISDFARTGLLNRHQDGPAAIEERLAILQKDLRAVPETLLPNRSE